MNTLMDMLRVAQETGSTINVQRSIYIHIVSFEWVMLYVGQNISDKTSIAASETTE
jgi:hypothetical protein